MRAPFGLLPVVALLVLCSSWLTAAGAQSGGDAVEAPGTSRAVSGEPTATGRPQVVDVLVYGSEPEAIIAAVAAAEEGASVVMVTKDQRLGGLFVLGELNVLDLKTQPRDYQLGLFDRWWRRVGRDEAFDVERAEAAFEALLGEAGVAVHRAVTQVEPVVAAPGEVTGVAFVSDTGQDMTVLGSQVIDGTADADLAAASGVGFDLGWRAFGVDQRMADTLVFRVAGVDWSALTRGVIERGRGYAVAKDSVVWGHFGGIPAAYQPSRPGLRLRGLNLGRQLDGTVLVNALLIYGIDPLDPQSRAAGRERAIAEVPAVIAYLAGHVPGFAGASFAGAAEELYVRESRHLRAACVLSADDVFSNTVTPFDVAAGGYPLDAQTFTPHDSGFVFGVPEIYGGRLCMMVPAGGPSDIWVVGRSAGYDPVAFASARVVPFGMAMAEAAGVAAALAAARDIGAQTAATGPSVISDVRARLADRGAYLPDVAPRAPVGPSDHPSYDSFRTLVSRGLTVAGYDNDPRLDRPVTVLSFAYLLSNVATRFHARSDVGQTLVDVAIEAAGGEAGAPLDAGVAVTVTRAAACALGACPQEGWAGLVAAGLTDQDAPPAGAMDRGQAYALAAALADYQPAR